MITVIIAGGSGTRLWPLSTHDKPKQLIQLVNGVSPLQEAISRTQNISSKTYVVPEIRLIPAIKEQFPTLGDDSIIVEPGLRGTASCYILALDTIIRRHDIDEPIAFIWADHHVQDVQGFEEVFELAAATAKDTGQLVTVGVEPTYPAALGYIERGEEVGSTGVYDVISFKEKPAPEIALDYIAAGNYLWNSGYYIGTARAFVGAMQAKAPDLYREYHTLEAIADQQSDEYRQAYLAFENTTIDVGLSEKMDNLLVVPARFDWLDIGNFKDLHQASDLDDQNNHLEGDHMHALDVTNTYIRNDTNMPVAVIGLDNVVVVNTPDGILVARKDVSHRAGEIAKKLQADS